MEQTFAMVKPGAVQRELIGEIITRFEKKGIKLVGLKLMQMSEELAKQHYAEHTEKPFFDELVKGITAGPVVAMVLEGENVINIVRTMAGATRPSDALPGTIRGDYVLDTGKNVIHTSDSKESAIREINLFFKKEEIINYSLATETWIYVLPKTE
ncbi:nucleoside diphosphate kinase [Hypnocyclicus thermotrophus]|uniref:Nucleoside diphosphate kinase n=1 Tax=Hypnocyclicus thermotrophus TaxID=1627895 RepID=A0AA46DXX7_9FUSO|nr:nucleoside-diphosphate kinase [Hypnocyclicus thermotrophus]TDT68653.1 nucleoside diphosphate kinase [Hypnocyclicus thermotrophus]